MDLREYDRTADYAGELKEQVKKILLLAERAEIPLFMSFAVKNGADGTKYVNEVISPGALGFRLKDDRIAKHVLVVSGFDLVPHAGPADVDYEMDFSGDYEDEVADEDGEAEADPFEDGEDLFGGDGE